MTDAEFLHEVGKRIFASGDSESAHRLHTIAISINTTPGRRLLNCQGCHLPIQDSQGWALLANDAGYIHTYCEAPR